MASKSFALTIFFIKVIAISCKRYGSLSIVIDDTTSMQMEIDTVKNESSKFMDIILTQNASQISDVVIVTFNDPEKSNLRLTQTRDREEVKRVLDSIKVHDGRDCPEYSLAGINTALMNSRKNSYLFVFTDASPKDGYVRKNKISRRWKLNKEKQEIEIAGVKRNAQSKESQIFFFLTKPQNCTEPESLYEPYWDIAADTNGQVFKINEEEDLAQFLNYMNTIISGEGNMMARKEIKANERASIPFFVDNQTEFVTVSASTKGNNVDLDISSGPTRAYEKIAWTKNNKILKIKSPAPGNYAVTVQGSDITTIMVTGRTDFTFQHGFSDTIPPTFSNEKSQPIEGKESHLLIKVYDPTNTVDIKTVQISSPDDKTIVYLFLTLNNISDGYYATEKFVAPSNVFIITVIGEGKKTGETIKRSAKTPIQPRPQNLEPPLILTDNNREYEAIVGDDVLVIPCDVAGYPKPNITWRPESPSGTQFYVNSNGSLVIKNPTTDDHNKNYICTATNDLGKTEKSFVASVTKNIDFYLYLDNMTNVVVLRGRTAHLKCESEILKGRWFKNGEPIEETGTLTVESVPGEDDGVYTCRISDCTGSKSHSYFVQIFN